MNDNCRCCSLEFGISGISDSTPPLRRIIGIDPGLRLTGYGVIELRGQKLGYVTSGVIRVPTGPLSTRLKVIFDSICEVVQTYGPTEAAIEKVFVNVNPASTLLLGQARGAAITALAHADLPVTEFTALQIKQSIVGYGRATKAQMQLMVTRLLSLPGEPSADAADALGCALCLAQIGSMMAQSGNIAPGLAKKGFRVKHGRLVES
jgi:crossover junction endodeoxyribonuclease RuvC